MTEICVIKSSGIMRGLFHLLYLTGIFLKGNETPSNLYCMKEFSMIPNTGNVSLNS